MDEEQLTEKEILDLARSIGNELSGTFGDRFMCIKRDRMASYLTLWFKNRACEHYLNLDYGLLERHPYAARREAFKDFCDLAAQRRVFLDQISALSQTG
jgi:hypothetical protein